MQLHIVRHGQTHWNAERRIQGQLDSELDDTGIQQAKDRGADFSDIRLTAAYASSSLRTRQTIQLILGERKDPVTLRDDLREVNLGIWQGQLWPDIQKKHPEMVDAFHNASPLFDVDGAETAHEIQQRGVSAIEDIIQQHAKDTIKGHAELTANSKNNGQETSRENILIVSHGAIMKTILAHYAHIPLSHLCHLPSLSNCAHCIIKVTAHQRQLVTVAGKAIDETQWANPSQIMPHEPGTASALPAV